MKLPVKQARDTVLSVVFLVHRLKRKQDRVLKLIVKLLTRTFGPKYFACKPETLKSTRIERLKLSATTYLKLPNSH